MATVQEKQISEGKNNKFENVSNNDNNNMPYYHMGTGRYIYSVFHTVMAFIAIYLSFRCNNGFKWGSFLLALLFPYIYIIYILATQGTCGIIPGEK
jgi:hypothetical protein